MRGLLVLSFMAIAASAQSLSPEQTAELKRATKNPFELARFVDAHPAPTWNIAWESRGNRLTVAPDYRRVGEHCMTQVISLMTPEQGILLVECLWQIDYIRYTRQNDGAWRCEGTWGSLKYPRRHKVDRSGPTPFFRALYAGNHGSGLDEEREAWFDLSRPGFEPGFEFTVKGWEYRMAVGIGRKISSNVDASTGEIQQTFNIDFTAETRDGEITIESRTPTVIFGRVGSSVVFRCRSVNQGMSCADFAALSDLSEAGPSEEDLLRVCLTGLKRIASGPNNASKQWLREYMGHRKDTPEVRELRALLK
jgi:hypothetical protein